MIINHECKLVNVLQTLLSSLHNNMTRSAWTPGAYVRNLEKGEVKYLRNTKGIPLQPVLDGNHMYTECALRIKMSCALIIPDWSQHTAVYATYETYEHYNPIVLLQIFTFEANTDLLQDPHLCFFCWQSLPISNINLASSVDLCFMLTWHVHIMITAAATLQLFSTI